MGNVHMPLLKWSKIKIDADKDMNGKSLLNLNQVIASKLDGYISKYDSDMDAIIDLTSIPQQYTRVLGEYEVTSGKTSVTFSGLDSDTYKGIILYGFIENNTASSGSLKVYLNGETDDSKYYTVRMVADGSSVTTVRENNPIIGVIPMTTRAALYGFITGGKGSSQASVPAGIFILVSGRPSEVKVYIAGLRTDDVLTPIRSITLQGTVDYMIGPSSRLFVLGVKA